jgi:RNA polymerase sigma-70 factor (ECF subfamily)
MLNATPTGGSVAEPAGHPAAAMNQPSEAPALAGPDAESRAWVAALQAEGAEREDAQRRLHELLLKAARFEINRRRAGLPHLRGGDFDDLAHHAAGDAMVAILGKLETYRGESRFSRRAWQGREIPLEPEDWSGFASGGESPGAKAEEREVMGAIGEAIEAELSAHQREVLVAVALNGVPIDVLAERLSTTRGALYKTIHDARKKLRDHLSAEGLRFTDEKTNGDR